MRENKNTVKFENLNIGDCFVDKDNIFCIKVNSTTCLYFIDDLKKWENCEDCDSFEKVFPLNTEIHIVS